MIRDDIVETANLIGTAWGASNSLGKALSHGLSRAVISKAQGGKWSAGFWSGFAATPGLASCGRKL